ncbi:MAG: zinc finger HIT domain-containing protein [Desulfatiglans sp.]|nr:hypothetical protein [Thermodesulfobacteriota bacterium]MEE4353958.1 zinc finger HIT domain-containing protein [Desulfatiglans sp.]
MAETCSVCGKTEKSINCSECGVPLCDSCTQKIELEQLSPGSTHKGVTTSTMRPAVIVKKVCSKCAKEVDFF